MEQISWIAVIASTVTAFVHGGLWYGPLFCNPRIRETGVGPEFTAPFARSTLFALAVTLDFVAAVVFALFVGPRPNFRAALGTGAAIGLAWVTPSMFIAYLFAGRSLKLTTIDAGYVVVQFFLFAAVFFYLG